jgi:hypothetical protein
MDIGKSKLRKSLEELEQARGEVILAKYRLEEAMDDFDSAFGPGAARKAIRLLRSKGLTKKLILTKESLGAITNEIYDVLIEG